jgi:tripartite-type tricarboxylate transporter receptor subunit TctC
MKVGRYLLAAVTLLLAWSALAQAEDYPANRITVIVPYAAGGPTDIATRIIADKMQAILGKPMIVENRPGAATATGATFVAQAKPDGYTLLMMSASTFTTNPFLYKDLQYKAEDFAIIGTTVKVPYAVHVHKSIPVKDVKEFIAWAKANRPDGVVDGTTGTGSNPHILSIILSDQIGVKMQYVPYRGTSQVTNDLIAGTLDMALDAITAAQPMHEAGQTRIIGFADEKRWPKLPDVPTFAEQGYPKAIFYSWFALVAPAKTPQPIIEKLHKTLQEVLAVPEMQEKLIATGLVPMPGTIDDSKKFIESEIKLWGDAIKNNNITIQ